MDERNEAAGGSGEAVDRDGGDAPRAWRRRVLVLVLFALMAAGVALAAVVETRLAERRAAAPGELHAIEGPEGRTGSFEASVSYTTMAAPGVVTTEVAWDDGWFFEDPTAYNHELATTRAVLSAVANSESSHHQAGSETPAYMEQALAELGFEEVSTSSYSYRSEVYDEVVDALVGTDDVVAYTIASKHVTDGEGNTKTLYLVVVRGSYGSEWLSDLNMGDPADYDMDAIDHEGFMMATDDIMADLEARITEDAGEGGTDDITLLFCGHSRGAAVANLAASYADDMTLGLRPLAPLGNIYCYTFATPEITTVDTVDDPLYDNIYNVLNPSDMVPRLPLAAWGYGRYGHDLWLPGYGDEGFDERHEAMCAAFEASVGVECPYVPEDRKRVDALEADLARDVPTADDVASAGGMAAVLRGLLVDVDVMQVLCGHYPSVYIAWMQATEAGDLREG